MAELLHLIASNPNDPNLRHLIKALEEKDALIAYPSDSGYGFACHMRSKKALQRLCNIKHIESKHPFSLICANLKQVSQVAQVDNDIFRLIKQHTPGCYTFVLPIQKSISKYFNPKRATIGIRIPDHPIAQLLVAQLQEPMISSSLDHHQDTLPPCYPEDIESRYGDALDYIIDAGFCGQEASTVLDCSDGAISIMRHGAGDSTFLES